MVTSHENTRSMRHTRLTRARAGLRAGQDSRLHPDPRMPLPHDKAQRAAAPRAQLSLLGGPNNYGAVKRIKGTQLYQKS